MKDQNLLIKKNISGWAKTNSVKSFILEPKSKFQLKQIVKNAKPKSIIPRGLGRSYGDAAQLKDKFVVNLKHFNSFKISKKDKIITAGGGVSLDQILKFIIPKGFFIPVSPGTKNVTIGGSIACDVHGKNHHINGSFGSHILEIKLIDGNANEKILKPNDTDINLQNQFWATIGGMGLTGIIYEAKFKLIEIETSLVSVDTFRYKDLNSLMQAMIKVDKKYNYSVAWIDPLHSSKRGILTCGNHAKENLIKDKQKLRYKPKSRNLIPSFLPNGLINKFTVNLFNKFWYMKHPKYKKDEIQTISKFFHPLDGIKDLNKIYGNQGFVQYQFVIPDSASYLISKILDSLNKINAPSFLTVLKRLGKSNKGYLSFPMSGWTLTIDIPSCNPNLKNTLNRLDKLIAKENGRIYLSKDSRQTSKMFLKTYKKFDMWLKIKYEMDPKCIFTSDLAERCKFF